MLESPGNLKFPLQQISESLDKWEEDGFAWWRTHISGDQANSTQKGRRTQAFKLRSEHTDRRAIVLPFCTGHGILSLSKTLKQSCLQTVDFPPAQTLSAMPVSSRSLLAKTLLKWQTWMQVSKKCKLARQQQMDSSNNSIKTDIRNFIKYLERF